MGWVVAAISPRRSSCTHHSLVLSMRALSVWFHATSHSAFSYLPGHYLRDSMPPVILPSLIYQGIICVIPCHQSFCLLLSMRALSAWFHATSHSAFSYRKVNMGYSVCAQRFGSSSTGPSDVQCESGQFLKFTLHRCVWIRQTVVAGCSPSLRQKCCPLPPDLSVCDVVCFWFPALYTLLPSLENLGTPAALSKLESILMLLKWFVGNCVQMLGQSAPPPHPTTPPPTRSCVP